MPKGTISYRIASEVAGIDIGDIRYRATRSSRIPDVLADGPPVLPSGPWTLWHDDREGGAHTVGYSDAYAALEQALDAAVTHDKACDR